MTNTNHTQVLDARRDPRAEVVSDRRPWGGFSRYSFNEVSTVKLITVEPGQSLSLQRHEHRDELWVALDDGLVAEVGDEVIRAAEGDEIWIPRGTRHRVSCVGRRARFLEIAFGTFDEDDIERFEDQYGRS